jgi:transcriptional regulator with XRE-family HTH domain
MGNRKESPRCTCQTACVMRIGRTDVVLNLREMRRKLGLTQVEVSRRTGVHVQTLSSFETGRRVHSMKLSQLLKLLRVYGISPAEFFIWSPEE